MVRRLRVRVNERWFTVQVGDLDVNPVRVLVDGEPVDVDLERLETTGVPEAAPQPSLAGSVVDVESPASPGAETAVVRRGPARVFRSPMPGVVLSVAVEKGQQVVTGDEVCVLEAMKMQQSLRADWSGVISTVHVKPGQQVLDGDPIVELG